MKVRRKLVALFSVLVLLVGVITPKAGVYATSPTYEIGLSGATEVAISGNVATISYKDNNNTLMGTVTVTSSNINTVTREVPTGQGTETAPKKYLLLKESQVTFVPEPASDDYELNSAMWYDNGTGNTFASPYKKTGLLDKDDASHPNYDAEFRFQAKTSDSGYGWDPSDPSVYFVWGTEGETGTFFYHKITGIPTDNSMLTVNVADVKDYNDSTKVFDLSKQTRTFVTPDGSIQEKSYEFVWSEGMSDALKDASFDALPTSEKFQYLREHRMTIDPVGSSPATANSIHCAGDHSFNVTIINSDKYKPVEVVPERTKYVTEYDNQFIQAGTLDISGSTESNPLRFSTFLLEDTLSLRSMEISDISAVGTTGQGVAVTKGADGKWTIKYLSNFYDEVTLAITMQDGTTGYITILRKNVALKNFYNKPSDKSFYAEVVYPDTDSYKTYKVIFTGVTADGTKETTIIDTPNNELEDAFGGELVSGYEMKPQGTEGIKKAWYKLPIENGAGNKYTTVYINVVKDFTLNSETYGGTLQGNGIGIEFRQVGNGYRRVLSNGQFEQ